MKYFAEIDVMPHKELLDPQGKTVAASMKKLNIQGIEDVRIGKHIKISFEAIDEAAAKKIIIIACEKLLANLIMESYSFTITPVK